MLIVVPSEPEVLLLRVLQGRDPTHLHRPNSVLSFFVMASTDGTPPLYTRQVGSGYGGFGVGIPNRSLPL